MNIQQLEYVVALDEHRHFVAAAESCFVTQPTLTLQLRKLEEDLGVQLLDRSPKPLTPPAGGELFIVRARRILRESSEPRGALNGETNTLEWEYRLGIIPTLAPHLL